MEIRLTQSYLKNFASKTSLIKNPSGTAPNCTSSKLFHFGNWLMQSFDEKQNLYYNGNNINHSGDDIDAILRNVNEEEQVALWREGRRREPMPVEIDF